MPEYFACATMHYSHLVQSQLRDVKFSVTISILFVHDHSTAVCKFSWSIVTGGRIVIQAAMQTFA